MKIKIGDNVMITKGKDVGKSGKIERLLTKNGKAVIAGINIYKKNSKPSKKNPKGGIIDVTMPVAISNLRVVCPHCSKPARIGYKIIKDEKFRICKKCKDQI